MTIKNRYFILKYVFALFLTQIIACNYSTIDIQDTNLSANIQAKQPSTAPKTRNTPTGQDTPLALLIKFHASLANGEKESFLECVQVKSKEDMEGVNLFYESQMLMKSLREKIIDKFGPAAWDLYETLPQHSDGIHFHLELIPYWDTNWPSKAKIDKVDEEHAIISYVWNESIMKKKLIAVNGKWAFQSEDITRFRDLFQKVNPSISKAIKIADDPDIHLYEIKEACGDIDASDIDATTTTAPAKSSFTETMPDDKGEWITGSDGRKYYKINPKSNMVIYVIDFNNSSKQSFELFRKELQISINALKGTQMFHVIFAGKDSPVEGPAAKPVLCDKKSRDDALELVKSFTLSDQTDLLSAAKKALPFIKDNKDKEIVIYLLSDGNFKNGEALMKLISDSCLGEKSRVRINAYLYNDEHKENAEILKKIASENNGRFKNVELDK